MVRYEKSMSEETFWERESTSEHDLAAPTTVIEEPIWRGTLSETVLPVSYADDFRPTGTMTTRQELQQPRRANLSLLLSYVRYVVTVPDDREYNNCQSVARSVVLCALHILFTRLFIGDVRVRLMTTDRSGKLNFEIERALVCCHQAVTVGAGLVVPLRLRRAADTGNVRVCVRACKYLMNDCTDRPLTDLASENSGCFTRVFRHQIR